MRRMSLLLLFYWGCASNYQPYIPNVEDVNYLRKAMKSSLLFTIPEEFAEIYWARANSFIAQYSGMRIQIANDYTIQTYDPIDTNSGYGYSATKIINNSDKKMIVACLGYYQNHPEVRRNAHIFSYYVQSGEIVDVFLGRSFTGCGAREKDFAQYYTN